MSERTAEPLSHPPFHPAPTVTAVEARGIAREAFGLEVEATPLDGEQDRNFHLQDDGGRHFVMKLSAAADRAMIELQNAALEHIAVADPGCVVPRVIRPNGGQGLVRIGEEGRSSCCARILSFVHGRAIGELKLSPAQFERLGAAIARLDRALFDFEHDATRPGLIWDIRKARDARSLLRYVNDPEDRDRAAEILDTFERRVQDLAALRAQFVHHDLNPGNVIALPEGDAETYGFIDFGDIVHAPLISELAIAAAYNVAAEGHPLSTVRALLHGYGSVTPLLAEEIDLLFTLITVRLVQSLAISHWRAEVTPKNSAYLLRYGNKARRDLQRLATLSEEAARRYLSAR